MNSSDLELLKSSVDEEVKLHFTDGEVSRVRVVLIGEDEEDVIYDLISTSNPRVSYNPNRRAAYRALWTEIEKVEK